MISRKALVALATSLFLTIPLAQALEPVDPQPAVPLTFEDPAYQKVVPEVAREMIADGVVVIDVREPIERLKEGFIKGSVNIPLGQLKKVRD